MEISKIQQQFWINHTLDRNHSSCNLVSLIKIDGELNHNYVQKSIDSVIKQYKILNSNYIVKDSSIIFNYNNLDNTIIKKKYSVQEVNKAVNYPFDLSSDSLFKTYIFDMGNGLSLLLFVYHHIVIDLRSKDIITYEFCKRYNACIKGEEVFQELSPQYDEYLKWYKEFRESDKYKKMISYWENEEISNNQLTLSRDKVRPTTPSYRGKRINKSISDELNTCLNNYCSKNSIDPFLVLLTSYSILLYRYSGQRNLNIGIPRTNRPGEKYQNIVGCFVNILPLCLHLKKCMTFRDLLRQVRLKMLGMHRNQNIPFLDIIELRKDVNKDSKYNPLFQVGFTSEHPMELELEGVKCRSVIESGNNSLLDLFLYYWNDDEGYHFSIEFSTALFSKKYIDNIFDSYITILENVISDDELLLDNISILNEEIKEEINNWNRTGKKYPHRGGIITSFLEQVVKNPENKALLFNDDYLSYGDLYRRVSSLASYLVSQGIKRETIVGLSMERSLEMVIGMYAIVLAGGTYLPLEPTLPHDYISYILDDSKLDYLITKRSYEKLYFGNAHTIYIDEFDFETSDSKFSNPEITMDDRVYILYTSGSTGRPKGVEITHRGLLNRIYWMDDEYKLNKDDVLFQKTPFNFDVSGWEFWWPLMKGVPLVIAEADGHKDNKYLIETIERRGVTKIHFVPSMLREFLNSCSPGQCPGLKEVFCSGEALPTAVVHEFYQKLPHIQLHNLYGPTEASIDVTYWPCTSDCTTVPIGRPIANTKIYILDENQNLLPPGITGEIFLAGTGLARGYLNKPDLTKERFIPNPFDGSRMYKTGDLGQWNCLGEVLYLGRNDSQVQLHGLRIELGEIENTLNNHDNVEVSAVIVHGDFGADQSLLAYVKKRGELEREELIEYMEQHLPLHMVPRQILFIEEIKLNSNGKLDRKSLPAPETIELKPSKEHEPPKGDMENTIAQLWEELLHLEGVGRCDHFLDVGGSSLHIIQLQKKLRDNLGRDIPITDLFTYTTVSSLARYLEKGENQTWDEDSVTERINRSRKAAKRLKNIRKR